MRDKLHTTIVNGTTEIEGSRTSCCSRGSRKPAGRALCDVANGSAGSCAITIKTPRELAGQAIIKPPFGGCHVRLKSANSRAAPWVRRLSINNRGMFKSQSKRIFA